MLRRTSVVMTTMRASRFSETSPVSSPTSVAVDLPQVAVFLVRERLDRRGVEDPADAAKGVIDAELGDDRLPASGWCGHHHRVAGEQGADRVLLEQVQREGQRDRELIQRLLDPELLGGVAARGLERRSAFDDFGCVVLGRGGRGVHMPTSVDGCMDEAGFANRLL